MLIGPAGELRRNSALGRVAGTHSVLRIEFDNLIHAVDDLIHPPEPDALLAPGFIDLQVNGYSGHDLNAADVSPDTIVRSRTRAVPRLTRGSAAGVDAPPALGTSTPAASTAASDAARRGRRIGSG